VIFDIDINTHCYVTWSIRNLTYYNKKIL